MGWGNSFDDKPKAWSDIKDWVKYKEELNDANFKKLHQQDWSGIDLGSGDQTVLTIFEDGEFKHRVVPPEELHINRKPTHDPYANPNAHIYYECSCGAILDPKTKSFAALNNAASMQGWKVRFGEHGYTPYCVKCGEGVE